MRGPEPTGASEPRLFRYGVAAALLLDAAVLLALDLLSLSERPARLAEVDHPIAALGSPPLLVAVFAAAALALAAFARRPARLAAGAAALVLTGLLMTFFQAYTRSTSQFVVFGGAAMLGWLAGLLFARIVRTPGRASDAERLAATGALAVYAAIYVRAGLNKLLVSGLDWVDPSTMHSTLLIHWDPDPESLRRRFQEAALAFPATSAALTGAVVLVQLGAFSMLLSRRARLAVAGVLTGFHLAVFAVTPILFQTALFLSLLVGLPGALLARRLRPDPAPSAPGEPPSRARLALAAAALASLAGAAAAIPWERLHPRPIEDARERLAEGATSGSFTVTEVTEPGGDRFAVYVRSADFGLARVLVLPPEAGPFPECGPEARTEGRLHVCVTTDSPYRGAEAVEAVVRLVRP